MSVTHDTHANGSRYYIYLMVVFACLLFIWKKLQQFWKIKFIGLALRLFYDGSLHLYGLINR